MVQMSVAPIDVFRWGKITYKLSFPGGTACAALFLYLVTSFFCHYNKPAFELNLKFGS
jgi:hypothetical protein